MKCRTCGRLIENPQSNQVYCKSCAAVNNKRQKAQLCGVFRPGERGSESRELARIQGAPLLVRRMRLYRYTQAVDRQEPILYDERFSMQGF